MHVRQLEVLRRRKNAREAAKQNGVTWQEHIVKLHSKRESPSWDTLESAYTCKLQNK